MGVLLWWIWKVRNLLGAIVSFRRGTCHQEIARLVATLVNCREQQICTQPLHWRGATLSVVLWCFCCSPTREYRISFLGVGVLFFKSHLVSHRNSAYPLVDFACVLLT